MLRHYVEEARGYRSTRNLITMAYFIAGKPDLRNPSPTHPGSGV